MRCGACGKVFHATCFKEHQRVCPPNADAVRQTATMPDAGRATAQITSTAGGMPTSRPMSRAPPGFDKPKVLRKCTSCGRKVGSDAEPSYVCGVEDGGCGLCFCDRCARAPHKHECAQEEWGVISATDAALGDSGQLKEFLAKWTDPTLAAAPTHDEAVALRAVDIMCTSALGTFERQAVAFVGLLTGGEWTVCAYRFGFAPGGSVERAPLGSYGSHADTRREQAVRPLRGMPVT